MSSINFSKAAGLGLNPQQVTQGQYAAALAAAEGNDLTVNNAPAILDAVVAAIRQEKGLDQSAARELALATHSKLRANGLRR